MQKIGFGNDLVVFLVICDQALKIAGGSYSWTVDTFTLLNSTKVLICVHLLLLFMTSAIQVA